MLGANVKNKYIALLSSTALIFFAAEASAQSAPPAIYVTPARTLTNGQTTPLFTDVNGNLKITGTLTGFASTPTFNCGTGCYQTTQPVSQGAGSVVSGAYLSGAYADGAISTLGTQADTAWTSGNGTGISLLKAMATSLSGIAAGTAASSTLPIYGQATTSAPSYTTGTANPLSLDTAGNLRVNVVTGGTSGTVAQGSTTSGQSGMLIQGAVTTSAPSYTTAQTSPLSLTTSGALRHDISTYAGTALTGTVTAYGTAPTGNVFGVNSYVTNSVAVTQATASSLNATVVGTGTFATQSAQSGTWTVQPGNTANTTPWLARISDGTNAAAIKAASTAAAATDPALVVSLSPNTTPVANASAFLNDANATATQIVALSGTTKIYVSAYSIVASVAENVKFQVGTGTNCGTNTADATANMAFAANGGIAAGSGVAPLFIVPAGYALCVTASTTGPTAVNVSYSQF